MSASSPRALVHVHPLTRTRRVASRPRYGFGWGRRFCAGAAYAQASLFIVCARIVWGLDFHAPTDKTTGRPRVPDPDDERTWSDGILSSPGAFPLSWRARDARRAEVINQAYEAAQGEWRARGMEPDER